MRRFPGIVFSDTLSGRRARLAGTGIEIWEIISIYLEVDEKFSRLQNAYHWLTENQLRAALGYYRLYRNDIDAIIKRNESWNMDRIEKTALF
jgi:uncharacterized protein (DUF433 family)